MALQRTVFLRNDMEDGSHRFVVGDALRVVAFYDALHYIRHDDLLLFHHFVVMDDVKLYVRSHYRKAADFFVGEESVGYLDEAFLA